MNKKNSISAKIVFVVLFLLATNLFTIAQNGNTYNIWRDGKVIGKINGSDIDSVKINSATKEMVSYLSNVDSLVFVTSYETGEATDRDTWKVLFCNSDKRFTDPNNPNGFGDWGDNGVASILDNNLETFWRGNVNGLLQAATGVDDYVYAWSEWHAFYGTRENFPVTVVIDMKTDRIVSGIGIVQEAGPQQRVKNVEVYVSGDPAFLFKPIQQGGEWSDYQDVALNNWKPALTYNEIPNEVGPVLWYELANEQIKQNIDNGVKGRFLKIKITGYYDWPIPAMVEFFVKEVKE